LPFLSELKEILCHHIKYKEWTQVDELLNLLISICQVKEAQITLVRVPGILTELVDLMIVKSASVRAHCVELLRILSCLKENKAHFLSEGKQQEL
jgi:hypothetical protein